MLSDFTAELCAQSYSKCAASLQSQGFTDESQFYFSLEALQFITLPGHLSTCAVNSLCTQIASACTQKCGTLAGDL